MRGDERIPSCISLQIHQRPVIQSGALQIAILERIAERAQEMQPDARGGGQARNRAGILRDFGADEDDVEMRLRRPNR